MAETKPTPGSLYVLSNSPVLAYKHYQFSNQKHLQCRQPQLHLPIRRTAIISMHFTFMYIHVISANDKHFHENVFFNGHVHDLADVRHVARVRQPPGHMDKLEHQLPNITPQNANTQENVTLLPHDSKNAQEGRALRLVVSAPAESVYDQPYFHAKQVQTIIILTYIVI